MIGETTTIMIRTNHRSGMMGIEIITEEEDIITRVEEEVEEGAQVDSKNSGETKDLLDRLMKIPILFSKRS